MELAVVAATGLVGHLLNNKINKNVENFADEEFEEQEVQETVFGCTDTDADNYDPNAEEDDGSCDYSSQAKLDEIIEKQTSQREVLEVGGDPEVTYGIRDNLMEDDDRNVIDFDNPKNLSNEIPEELFKNREMSDYVTNNFVSPFVKKHDSYAINQPNNLNFSGRKLNLLTGNLKPLEKNVIENDFPGPETMQNIHRGTTIPPRNYNKLKEMIGNKKNFETPIESKIIAPGISRDPNYVSKGFHPENRINPYLAHEEKLNELDGAKPRDRKSVV